MPPKAAGRGSIAQSRGGGPVRTLGTSTLSRIGQREAQDARRPANVSRQTSTRRRAGPTIRDREPPPPVEVKAEDTEDRKPSSAEMEMAESSQSASASSASNRPPRPDTATGRGPAPRRGNGRRENARSQNYVPVQSTEADLLPIEAVSEEHELAPVSLRRGSWKPGGDADVADDIDVEVEVEVEDKDKKKGARTHNTGDFAFPYDEEGARVLMQFPKNFPRLEAENKSESGVNLDNLDDGERHAEASGAMGELQVHESGRVFLHVPGDVPFEIVSLTDAASLQDLVMLDHDEMTSLGQVTQKFAAVPDVEALFENLDLVT